MKINFKIDMFGCTYDVPAHLENRGNIVLPPVSLHGAARLAARKLTEKIDHIELYMGRFKDVSYKDMNGYTRRYIWDGNVVAIAVFSDYKGDYRYTKPLNLRGKYTVPEPEGLGLGEKMGYKHVQKITAKL